MPMRDRGRGACASHNAAFGVLLQVVLQVHVPGGGRGMGSARRGVSDALLELLVERTVLEARPGFRSSAFDPKVPKELFLSEFEDDTTYGTAEEQQQSACNTEAVQHGFPFQLMSWAREIECRSVV